jgi:hypothetical protein
MLASEAEVLRLAREMIKQHGPQAGFRASERLNDRIDEGDWRGRDVWARVVHAIHELQREQAGSPPRQTSRGAAPRGLWRLNKGPQTFSDQEAKGIAAPCLGGEVMLTKISERGVDSRSIWTFPDTAEMGHAGAAVAARALRGEYQVDLNEDLARVENGIGQHRGVGER